LQRADALGASIQFRYGQPLVLTELGKAWLVAGDQARAGECASRALALTRESRARGVEAYARRLLGEVAGLADPPDATAPEMDLREALSLADERGMRPLAAHCHLGLGKLYRRIDDRPRAEEHLTTASTMYREMEMAFWLDKAASELGSFR
jgi:hypothetical protein